MNPSAAARALGRKGGVARAERLSTAEKKQIARLGAAARIQSLQAARRIIHNGRYAAAVDALRGRPVVRRVSAFAGPLPDIHDPRS